MVMMHSMCVAEMWVCDHVNKEFVKNDGTLCLLWYRVNKELAAVDNAVCVWS
jgi:hypothetical protein